MNFCIIAIKVWRVYPVLRAILWIFICATLTILVSAQDIDAVIAALNIDQLRSVARIEFDDALAEAGTIDNGWFTLNPSGSRFAVINRDNHLIVWSMQGTISHNFWIPGRDGLPATVLDAAFNADGDFLASVHVDGEAYYVAFHGIGIGDGVPYQGVNTTDTTGYIHFSSRDIPLRIWMYADAWLEVSPYDPRNERYVLRLMPRVMDSSQDSIELSESETFELPSGPENDVESFLRIGRIDPPLAITVTQEGLVKRWNLETGEVTATAQLDSLPGAGQLNASGRYFVWRDAESANLYLLDFETGENRLVAPLNGTYIPFLFLSVDADVAIGVNVGLEPTVVAWNTAIGERYDLGEYRACNRQPDMVRLSRDGTTLVIGCDTGLDIWRIEGA